MNITLDAARGVALDKMNQMILASPWFLAHGEMAGTTNLIYRPEKHIEIVIASSNNQIIGRALFANFTDEVNFSLVANPEKQKTKMMKLITQIDARMKSRFLRGTYLPTLNIIASSKDTEQSFLEAYIDNKIKNESKNTLIVDEPQWVVDSRKDSPIKFYVAIGNKLLANELLPLDVTEEQLDEYRAKGYILWQVPIGYLDTFQQNLDEAICSVIGIATASSLKYISGVKLKEIKTKAYKNPFSRDIIEVGNAADDHLQYANFFDLSLISPEDMARPMFIHLDMSITGDKTGIAGVWITGKTANINRNPLLTDGNTAAAMESISTDSTMDMAFKLAFSVSVKAPKGAQVSFAKNRNFIRWLSEKGFAIKGISMDTFQSAAVFQDLKSDGYNTQILSVDRVTKDPGTGKPMCLPYHYLKQAIFERRIQIYDKCDLLTDELINLERKSDGHVDHPQNGCFIGSTKVSLVDGRDLTMLELIDEFNAGRVNWVYSFNEENKKIEPKPIINAFKTFDKAKLIEVELDNGEIITCTPNHRFMLRDGQYQEAGLLKLGDSLMPLYRKFPEETVAMKDYRLYYEPIEDCWHYEHRRFATEVLDTKYLVHHKNCIKTDNTPTNLVWCSKSAHNAIHAELQTGAQSAEANAKRIGSLINYYSDTENAEAIKTRNEKISETLKKTHANSDWNKLQRKRRQQHYEISQLYGVDWGALSNVEKNSYSVRYQRMQHPETQQKISEALSKNHKNGKFINAEIALQKSNLESRQLKELIPTIDEQKFIEIFGFSLSSLPAKNRPPYIVKYRKILGKTILNHKVVAIRNVDKQEAVYDLTIQDNHNFALTSGVFVHNSKDQADAVCGATYLASQFADEYSYSYGDNLVAALDANEALSEDKIKQQMVLDFQQELAKVYFETQAVEDKQQNAIREEYTYYQDLANGIIII